MTSVICIGECMVELSPAGPGLMNQGFAGDAYNTAVYLKRALPDAEVRFLTATGCDPLSQAMRAAWRAEGIDDSLAFVVADRRPAIYLIETDEAGDRRFHYWRSDSAARLWLQRLRAAGGASLLQGADLIYVSGISLAILPDEDRQAAMDLLGGLKGRVRLAFDPNLRPSLWSSLPEAAAVFEAFAKRADILLPSRQDLDAFYGPTSARAHLDRLTALGADEIVLTCEGDEALVFDGEAHGLQPPPAKVLDTSGGGDSFNGAYLAARLRGDSPVQAARAGLALAARVVEQRGALIPA